METELLQQCRKEVTSRTAIQEINCILISIKRMRELIFQDAKVVIYVAKKRKRKYKNERVRGEKTSKYYGVSRDTRYHVWVAAIWLNGKNNYIGRFDEEVDAAIAVGQFLMERDIK